MQSPVRTHRSSHLSVRLLDAKLGPEELRRIVRDPLGHGLAELPAPGDVSLQADALELLRTKYKPARKLTATYLVRATSDAEGDRHLAVSWFAQDDRLLALFSPADPAMPQLARLAEPGFLDSLVRELADEPPDADGPWSLTTVRYRPGQRHVLRASSAGGAAAVYAKTDREGSGARAVPVAELVATVLDHGGPPVVVRPVGWSHETATAVWWHAEGVRLSLLVGHGHRPALRVAQAGRVLRRLHDDMTTAVGSQLREAVGTHDHAHEARSTLRAAEHIRALLPDVATVYDGVVSDVVDTLARVDGEAPVFCHGDFKCDNLLVHGTGLRVLDLDRCSYADPALDLGKLVADLRWWCRPRDAVALTDALREGYGPCDPARWARADVLAALFQLKLAARRCALHDAAWTPMVRAQVHDARTALARARRP